LLEKIPALWSRYHALAAAMVPVITAIAAAFSIPAVEDQVEAASAFSFYTAPDRPHEASLVCNKQDGASLQVSVEAAECVSMGVERIPLRNELSCRLGKRRANTRSGRVFTLGSSGQLCEVVKGAGFEFGLVSARSSVCAIQEISVEYRSDRRRGSSDQDRRRIVTMRGHREAVEWLRVWVMRIGFVALLVGGVFGVVRWARGRTPAPAKPSPKQAKKVGRQARPR